MGIKEMHTLRESFIAIAYRENLIEFLERAAKMIVTIKSNDVS